MSSDRSPADSYPRSGFCQNIGWARYPALLLTDVCNAYWTKDFSLNTPSNPTSTAAPASIGRLVAAARNWVPGLEPKEGEIIIPKQYPSAFFATDLGTRLQVKGVDIIVICGAVSDACGDRSPEIHDVNVLDMNVKMTDVVPEAEAIEKLKAGWK
ncbi:Isochorismatase hydrolase [Zopfia rhizophila CBS 207.26]|uniref:Isochorismatase hydrolase n=1 Tax=Zopfia rhizophila CBS 207.26 TaxID=1314779 RepID=A0A6A6EDQ3_9PEZI|nr:Isochorismatase hydrolase [Zopfia rhizophila CBS 207.26]